MTTDSPTALSELEALLGVQKARDLQARTGILGLRRFVDVLQRDVVLGITDLESQGKYWSDADREEKMSWIVVTFLHGRGYDVGTDEDHRGHVDIAVKCEAHAFTWLAEAKKDNGSKYLAGGLSQLLDDYSSGRDPDAGFIVYIRQKKGLKTLGEWREYVEQEQLNQLQRFGESSAAWFDSVHLVNGAEVTVRHFAAVLTYRAESAPVGPPPPPVGS